MLFGLKQWFYNPVCFKCGSIFVEDHLFCEVCFNSEILPRISLKQRTLVFEGVEVNHFYLFDWIPGESDLLSLMIYQLKSDRCVKALKFYSDKIAELFVETDGSKHFNCVLPLPGSRKSSLHSNIIGKFISENLELICQPVFVKKNTELQQKDLNSSARKRVRVQTDPASLSELFTKLQLDKLRPIYADDILTTGSTLKAAISALGNSNGACVMTLFYRPIKSENA